MKSEIAKGFVEMNFKWFLEKANRKAIDCLRVSTKTASMNEKAFLIKMLQHQIIHLKFNMASLLLTPVDINSVNLTFDISLDFIYDMFITEILSKNET